MSVKKNKKQENFIHHNIGDLICTNLPNKQEKPDYGIIIDVFTIKEETFPEEIYKEFTKYKVLFQSDGETVNYSYVDIELYKEYYQKWMEKYEQ